MSICYNIGMSAFLSYQNGISTGTSDFDFSDRIKPSAILEFFQNFAATHAEQIGIGFEKMQKQGLCWVLNRLSAVIDRNPTPEEALTAITFPHKPGMVDAIRDYYITDARGESVIRGTSRWCVLDTHSMAVRRVAPLFSYADECYNPDFAIKEGNPQLPEWESILLPESGSFSATVRLTDIDRNKHMNNARYADAVLNCCEYAYYVTHSIRAFDMNFLAQMYVNEPYTMRRKDAENVSYFEMTKPGSTRPVFRARIEWNA